MTPSSGPHHSGTAIDDDALLAVLGRVLSVDEPFPADVLGPIERAAFALRHADDELAELLFDTGRESTVVLRGDGPRALSYVADGVELDVELQPDGTINGRVAPVDVGLTVEGPNGPAELETDDLGRFTAAAPIGRMRFVLHAEAQAPRIVTPWIFR